MKNLIYLILFTLCFSCDFSSNEATIYNNALLTEHQKIGAEIKSYLELIKDTTQSKEQVALKEKILVDITNSISAIQNLSDFEGNTSFQKSVITVLNEYYKGVNTEYDAIVQYNNLPSAEKTEERRKQAELHAIHADQIITKAEDNFILMQQEFAKENNIKLD